MRRAMPILVWLIACPSVSGQHWPSFRGPNASGVSDGHPTLVKWNAPSGESVLWKTPIPGVAVSSPVVWGDRVFVSTAVSSDPHATIRTGLYGDVEPSSDRSRHSWRLVALDKRTGKVLWERVAHEGVPRTMRHPKSSQASPTPVTDGRHVVVSFGSEGLYTYDVDGKLLWKRDLGVLNAGWFYDPDYEWGVGSSPIIWKSSVIVQCHIQKNSFIAALDRKSTRLNSSHLVISYAVFCFKKKKHLFQGYLNIYNNYFKAPWMPDRTEANPNELNQDDARYGFRCCHLKNIWTAPLPPETELSRQMTTSTTSIDIMGLQAAYANLHTDQERDYFILRYRHPP